MKRIGLLSDTHGYWDERFAKYFAECDEIWHAGDIGSMEVADRLADICTLRAVHGNIDGGDVRRLFPEVLRFRVEEADILMKHIGGYPGNYDRSIRAKIQANPPRLFISGHSHILKVMRDTSRDMMYINPGAAGIQGWHVVRTALRFKIEDGALKDMEVFELPRNK